MPRRVAAVLALTLAACDDAAAPRDVTDAAAEGPARADAGGDAAGGAIGSECRSAGPNLPPTQGTCGAGAVCLSARHGFPNGYCARACTGGCPAGSACATHEGIPLCLRTCATHADCRVAEGHRCAFARGTGAARVCAPSGDVVGVRADGAACFAATGPHALAALPRRAFRGDDVAIAPGLPGSRAEAECVAAIDPRGGAAVSACIATAQASAVTVARSGDGRSWLGATAVVDPELTHAGDPALAFGRDGVLHLAFLGFELDFGGRYFDARVRVTESRDGGATWEAPRRVEPVGYCDAPARCDKPWIASGPSTDRPAQDAVYLGYQRSVGDAVSLLVQRSDDGGRAWSAPVAVVSGSPLGAVAPNLLTLQVDGAGALGAAWVALSRDSAVARLGDAGNRVLYRRSVDGGRGWEALRVASRPEDAPVFAQPALALDGARAHVAYVTGTEDGAWDVVVATSEDGGVTWRHRTVNDDPERCATHAFPAMAVHAPSGELHLLWLENRFGDGAVAYARCPSDPAFPCGRNEAVSDASFRLTTSRDPRRWHGDYLGLALGASGDLQAVWSDTRTGTPHAYAARARVP